MHMPRNQAQKHKADPTKGHTPGPWYVTEGPTYGVNSRLKVESAPDVSREFGMVICERGISTIRTAIDAECRANAHLIAQAPTMKAENERLRALCARVIQWYADPDRFSGDLADIAAQMEATLTN